MSSALQISGLPGKRRSYAAKTSSVPRLTATRIGNVVTVRAITSLVESPVYYHWYLDGAHVGSGTAASFSFSVEQAGQGRVECVDTLDPNFDPLSAIPAQFPARFTVHWVRSLDAETREYVVQQRRVLPTSTPYAEIARLPATEAWDYILLSERLQGDYLYFYQWRILPVDPAGNLQNTGVPTVTPGVTVVRNPDAPNWNYTYDEGTDQVTFAAA